VDSASRAIATADEIRAIDAAYRPIPTFLDFARAAFLHTDIWERIRSAYHAKRAAATSSAFDHALEVAVRMAALDTGAIELLYQVGRGFTISVATRAPGWEQELTQRGPEIRELFDAQLDGYFLALELANSQTPISEAWIRQLHVELCRAQDTYKVLTPQGEYKKQPNHVLQRDGARHAYAPVDLTPDEMHRLVEQFRLPELEDAHPVLQAAYAHYAFVSIHPFADGNGRVARALASVFLLRMEQVPLVVFADQRGEYLETLSAADLGLAEPFVAFVFDRAVETMELVTDMLVPPPEEPVATLRSLLTRQGGLSHEKLDGLGGDLLNELSAQFAEQVAKLALPEGISVGFNLLSAFGNEHRVTDDRYRESVKGPKGFQFTLESGPPARAQLTRHFRLLVGKDKGEHFPFLIERLDTSEIFQVRLADMYPHVTTHLRMRLRAWVRSALAEFIARFSESVAEALRQSGYST
jgi:Fic family protein